MFLPHFQPPLSYAAWKGHKEIVEFLLQSGAEIDLKNVLTEEDETF
jgi:ankyrin repeat protein